MRDMMTIPYLQLVPRNEEQEQRLNSLITCSEKYDFIVNYYKNYEEGELECYCEVHHIVPKSCGGSDESDNLVKLPAEIHYIVHFLLPIVMKEQHNIDGYQKMLYAFASFYGNIRHGNIIENDCINLIEESIEFAKLRKEHSLLLSKRNKEWYGNENNLKRICIIQKEVSSRLEVKIKRSISQHKRYEDKNEREKSRIKKLGKPMSEEACKRMSESQSRRYKNPEERMKCANRGEKNGMYGRRGSRSIPSQMMWIKNEVTGESKYIKKTEVIPDGWMMGRFNMYDRKKFAKMWITNGIEDRYISKNNVIPDGWKRGKTNSLCSAKGKIWITDGVHNKFVDKTFSIPDGWRKGISSKRLTGGPTTTGMFWINNGIRNKFCNGEIPSGWKKGRLPRNKKCK